MTKVCLLILDLIFSVGSVGTHRRDAKGRQDHKPLHDCLPSKRSHDTIPLYQGDARPGRGLPITPQPARPASAVPWIWGEVRPRERRPLRVFVLGRGDRQVSSQTCAFLFSAEETGK